MGGWYSSFILRNSTLVEIRDINNLKVSEKKKAQLRAETLQNYNNKVTNFNKELEKEQRLANEELIKSNRDLQTSLIQNQEERSLKEAENRKNDALKALKDSKASAEEIANAKLLIDLYNLVPIVRKKVLPSAGIAPGPGYPLALLVK